MKRGICSECGRSARSKLSYFCDDCLESKTVAKAVAD